MASRRAFLASTFALSVTIDAFSASAIDSPLHLERHLGKVVVVDFWASWCKPCRHSIPWLNTMSARYAAQGLVIVGINVDAQRQDAERFLRDVPANFELVFDSSGELARRYQLRGMPSSFVYDRQGRLAERLLGFRDGDRGAHEAMLQRLLAATSDHH